MVATELQIVSERAPPPPATVDTVDDAVKSAAVPDIRPNVGGDDVRVLTGRAKPLPLSRTKERWEVRDKICPGVLGAFDTALVPT